MDNKKTMLCILFFLFAFTSFSEDLFFDGFLVPDSDQGYEDNDIETRLHGAIQLYINGGQAMSHGRDPGRFYLEAFNIFDALWRENRQDPKITLYYCYGILGYIASEPTLDEIMQYFMRVKGLMSYVIHRLPNNLDARNLRFRVYMNIPPAMDQRPDETILEDTEVYISGFSSLPPGLQSRESFRYLLGLNEAYIARALVLLQQGHLDEGRECLTSVDETVLQQAEEEAGGSIPAAEMYREAVS